MTPPASKWSSGSGLRGPNPTGDRSFSYALTDRSRENIRNLVADPAVEDTHQIDRPRVSGRGLCSCASVRDAQPPCTRGLGDPVGPWFPGRAGEHRSRPAPTGGANGGAVDWCNRSTYRREAVADSILPDGADCAPSSPESHGDGVRLPGASPRRLSSDAFGRRHVLAPDSRRSSRSASRAGTTRLAKSRRRPRSRISMPGDPGTSRCMA